MTNEPDFDTKLAKMAETLLDTADDENRLAVFKAVSTWRLGVKRAAKGEEEDDGGNFNEIRRKLRAVP